jgi:GH15 family glucan-1,4-alpha-glucosidase
VPSLIEDYALLSDLHAAALVGRDGSIDWLCLPAFDSAACFAALLGDESNGHWRIAPAGAGACTRRRYRTDTLILESEWDTPHGSVRILDAMPPRGEASDVVRIVEGISGRVPLQMTLRVRYDYGRIAPWTRRHDDVHIAIAGPDATWLDTPVGLTVDEYATSAEFTVAAGERVPFVLTYHPSHLGRPRRVDPQRALQDTEEFWRSWLASCTYGGRWDEAVRRSLLTLKALTYAPTGAIAAAATTSLPEQPGGPRNWDYRFCWLRDAAFTLQAMLSTGLRQEAAAWEKWLRRAVAGDPADLQIMYALDGSRRLTELELDWLPGYEKSAPVRVGNAAAGQFQLDVWGEVLDAFHQARLAGIGPDEESWALQLALLDYLEHHWGDADYGLWEIRGEPRQFVHSKVMAWAGFDRAVQAVERFGLTGPVERWRELRDQVHAAVCDHGFDADRNTFTQFYGSAGLDAALLLSPRVGFLPADDPRVIGTVHAVRAELDQGGFLRRYLPDADGGVDGLPGTEGAFLVCTYWLIDALHGIGEQAEAEKLFVKLLDLRNDLGLLSEEYDSVTGRQLGNTPQAFSHVGLINAARKLSGAATETHEESR